MPLYIAVQCSKCSQYQAVQRPKSRKWSCRTCGKKQSVVRVFAQSDKGKDIRPIVQGLNMSRAYEAENNFSLRSEESATDQSAGEASTLAIQTPQSQWIEFLGAKDAQAEQLIEKFTVDGTAGSIAQENFRALAEKDGFTTDIAAVMRKTEIVRGKRKRERADLQGNDRKAKKKSRQLDGLVPAADARISASSMEGASQNAQLAEQVLQRSERGRARGRAPDAPVVSSSGKIAYAGPSLPSLASLGMDIQPSTHAQTSGAAIGARDGRDLDTPGAPGGQSVAKISKKMGEQTGRNRSGAGAAGVASQSAIALQLRQQSSQASSSSSLSLVLERHDIIVRSAGRLGTLSPMENPTGDAAGPASGRPAGAARRRSILGSLRGAVGVPAGGGGGMGAGGSGAVGAGLGEAAVFVTDLEDVRGGCDGAASGAASSSGGSSEVGEVGTGATGVAATAGKSSSAWDEFM